MPTAAAKLLRAVRSASLASRTAAAAAPRAAAIASRSSPATAAAAARAAAKASRSSRAAAAAAARAARLLGLRVTGPLMSCPARGDASRRPRDDALSRSFEDNSTADYEHLPDDPKTPSDKDVESDDAIWALYSRWCKAFNKQRDHAEMARRFKIFRHYAKHVHRWNTRVPRDPKDAAKKREARLLISKGEDVSDFDDWLLPMELGPFADGGDPFIYEHCKHLLVEIEERDPFSAAENATTDKFL